VPKTFCYYLTYCYHKTIFFLLSKMSLSICRSIIKVHGGRIWGANRPEGGAVFSFTLPLEEGAPRLAQDLPEMKEDQNHEAAHPSH